mmetsp:Transcript_20942/g.54463  ORF Transcript_20942/g.54463 Transcript_20942/m.54463 type:complete len:363 (-) Transcript_20942:183-1271(-)|eukprot:CAMPEP_0182934686 /NCGR_PEP_ID=MMETSP0105_2-20130417/36644_1 /TAXON_ID=81532 ORGANISM="Acanthoeca-like sp., Strain 10tr" /NCGR_SAMPLE_ID=MMETSP0105_2 /ASSEMBLY_ACC=CAM_ASM_000205 /LENGTH=362 /DNA_ID=CAMNT_0025073565 /DNA_START=109 /DNA_END=1197 /DNA_ORIENTATION=+
MRGIADTVGDACDAAASLAPEDTAAGAAPEADLCAAASHDPDRAQAGAAADVMHRSNTYGMTRALIMPNFLPEVAAEVAARGLTVVILATPVDAATWAEQLANELHDKHIGPTDVVIALPSWIDVALACLGIAVPPPPDYPDCAAHLLQRKVWKSTLGELHTSLATGKLRQVFLKPAAGAKSFSGFVATGPRDEMLELLLDKAVFPALGPATPIHCGEVVEMNAEYAVFVVDGSVRSTVHYACKRSTCRCADGDLAMAGRPPLCFDSAVVDELVTLVGSSAETQALTGFRADFALVRRVNSTVDDGAASVGGGGGADDAEWVTALVEVNDGYVAGRYDGVSVTDYTDMILSRFACLQKAARA